MTGMAAVEDRLRCPRCHGELEGRAHELVCVGCSAAYPAHDGVPILIDESRSVFSALPVATSAQPRSAARRVIGRLLPSLGNNVRADENYAHLGRLLSERPARPLVLVVGGRIHGVGFDRLLATDVDLIETDAVPGARVAIVADVHDLPFADETFDAVVAQAVLEHVADPYRSVAEIHRVLKLDGLVYAEIPFMQAMHGPPGYDFTRFTYAGVRRLFARFDEISSGACCGPGMAAAWSLQYLLTSLARGHRSKLALLAIGRLSFFWLKYLDRFLLQNPYALEGASAYYFLGSKRENTVGDREIVEKTAASLGATVERGGG